LFHKNLHLLNDETEKRLFHVLIQPQKCFTMKSKLLHLFAGIFILFAFVQCDDSIPLTGPEPTKPGSDLAELDLISPQNNSEQEPSVSFEWEGIEAARSYQIQLAGDENFSSIIIDSVISAKQFKIQGLPYDSNIYWKVRAIGEQKEGPWSNSWKFTTKPKPANPGPISTNLLSPNDGATGISPDAVLKWTTVVSASAYKVQLATDQGFNTIIVDQEVESASFQTSNLDFQQSYYWKVEPIVPNGKTKWSKVYNFTTVNEASYNEPLPAPVQISPNDGASNTSLKPTFEWEPVEGADYYILHANRIDPAEMVINAEVNGTSYTPSIELDAGTTHDWRVRAVNDGVKGNWSEIHSFVTTSQSSGSPTTVTLISPEDGATNQPTSLTLEWEGISGISEYQVQMSTDGSFSTVILDESVNATNHDISGLENDKTFYWRVQANGDSDNQNWSSVYSFSTKPTQSQPPSNPGGSVEGDRQALVDLYQATGGSGWDNNSGWLNGNPSNSWYGVEVNGEGRVVRLDLSGNGLRGSLPESIGNLTALRYLNLKQNEMYGNIPSSIGNMTSLTHLLLNGRKEDMTVEAPLHPGKPYGGSWAAERSNNFTGPLPSSIGNLKQLEWLEISGSDAPGETGLTGPLPEELNNLTNLKGLSLGFNNITSIPYLGDLTELVHLIFENGREGSKLEGTGFPSWIGKLTNIKYLWMGRNHFGGELPDLSALTKLEIFTIVKNDLSGDFPDYVIDGTMPNMNMCGMGWNNFTGTLPEFGTEVNVTMFVVNGSSLSGRIPSSIQRQTRMTNLGLGWNNFSGQFPQDLTRLNRLRYIRANDNNFTGTVPIVDTSNDKLNFLHFQNNDMSGRIPSSLADIADLPRIDSGDLNISGNNFSPSDLQPLIDALDGNLNVLRYGTKKASTNVSGN
jgi:Leucine-rich repeat (LRR) protein